MQLTVLLGECAVSFCRKNKGSATQAVVSVGTGLKQGGFIQGRRAITDPSTFYLKCEIENMYLLTGQSSNF